MINVNDSLIANRLGFQNNNTFEGGSSDVRSMIKKLQKRMRKGWIILPENEENKENKEEEFE